MSESIDKKRRRLTQEEKRELIAFLEAGVPVKEIELKFNVTSGIIYQYRSGKYGVLVKPLKEQFESDTVKENGCWVWQKSTTIHTGSTKMTLLKAAYTTLVGPVPEGHVVSTTCKNSKCVNPEHLYSCKRGEALAQSNRKLNEEQVREIRKKYAEGSSLSKLGKEFGVKPATISHIINRRVWSHVE